MNISSTCLLALLPWFGADRVPEATKTIEVEVHVDLGDLAASAVGVYRVQTGDSLAAIARRFLGSEKEWQRIAQLNPAVEPNRLRVGQCLRVPARAPLPGGAERFLVYTDTRCAYSPDAVPLPVDGKLASVPERELVAYLVPLAAREDFEAALARGKEAQEERSARVRAAAEVPPELERESFRPLEALVESGQVHMARAEFRGRRIRASDPTVKRIDTYRLDLSPTGAVSLVLASSRSVAGDRPPPGAERDGEDDALLLVLLAAAGGVGLTLELRRRGPARARLA